MHNTHTRRTFLKSMMAAALGAGLSRSAKTFARASAAGSCSEADPCPYFLPVVSRPQVVTNIIFLHHSTGYNLIHQGNVRESLTAKGYSFWDHDYNSPGLSLPNGNSAGYNYNVPGDNTNPDGFNTIFQQTYNAAPLHPNPPANCFSGLMRHQVIIFKSCFPASAISGDDMLNEYKAYYTAIRARIDQYPDHIFIPFTTPPLHPCSTSKADAARARAFANWLTSATYIGARKNLFVFNFFNYLARADDGTDEANMLKAAYRPDYCDSHPNELANQTIGPIFVDFVHNSIKSLA